MSKAISRIAGRIRQWMYLVTFGHVLNPVWSGRLARRKKRYKATYESCMGYLERYADAIKKIKPQNADVSPEPERAFSIWFQGEENAPALVKSCFRSMRRHLEQELVVLDENTLFDWIKLPDYVVRKWKEGKIPHTQFSDICRVELLYTHGGIWLDATDFVTAPVPQYIMDEDVFMFMAGDKVRGSYAFIQSCFIRGRKGNPVLGVWREANYIYWKSEDSKINYFVHHLLLRLSIEVNEIAKAYFDKMTKLIQDPTHVLWNDHMNDVYSPAAFEKLTSGSFFQKTNYKDKRLNTLKLGTIADHILNL